MFFLKSAENVLSYIYAGIGLNFCCCCCCFEFCCCYDYDYDWFICFKGLIYMTPKAYFFLLKQEMTGIKIPKSFSGISFEGEGQNNMVKLFCLANVHLNGFL